MGAIEKEPYLHNPAFKSFADTVYLCLREGLLSNSQIEEAVTFARERFAREDAGVAKIRREE